MVQSCPHTVTAGSYVLGVLGARESSEFHQHADVCPYCRREVMELAPIVRLLEPLKAETQAVNRHLSLLASWTVQKGLNSTR